MKALSMIMGIALMAFTFAVPVMAADSIQLSREPGYVDTAIQDHSDENGVRGYFSGNHSSMIQPDVSKNLNLSRESGGTYDLWTKADPQTGFGVEAGVQSAIEQSKENGRW